MEALDQDWLKLQFFASKQDELDQIMEIVKQSFDAQAE